MIDGGLVTVMSWYDNELGYASQMLREALCGPDKPTPGQADTR